MHAWLKCSVAPCHWSIAASPCTLMIYSIFGLLTGQRQKVCMQSRVPASRPEAPF